MSMSESMTTHPLTTMAPRRGWLITATIGVALAALAMLTIALVMLDKKHFGWMVGTWFLETISAGMLAGGLVLVIGAAFLPERKTWRGIVVLAWGLIAFTSPAFGILFLFPWAVLALSLPLIIAILMRFFRTSERSSLLGSVIRP
jgi:MFS family permease